MLGLKDLLHHTYSEINLRFVFMLYFAFMYVCVPHTYRVPIKSEESIGFPKTEWAAMCVPETKPKSSGKAASAPAPKLNYFNMEMVV